MNTDTMSREKLEQIRKEKARISSEKCRKRLHDQAPMIKCKCGCGEEIKSIDAYGRSKTFVNGHSNRKYDDPNEYKRVYERKIYADPEWRAKKREWKVQARRQRKVDLIKLKGGKCNQCGIAYNGKNAAIYQLHHRDPSAKESRVFFDIAWKRTLKEADKCDLVCANCHFLIHGAEY